MGLGRSDGPMENSMKVIGGRECRMDKEKSEALMELFGRGFGKMGRELSEMMLIKFFVVLTRSFCNFND
jgi:hypothetical protein